ncbi:hypothetical protein V6N13_040234 [Hibiscus sabdariffa]
MINPKIKGAKFRTSGTALNLKASSPPLVKLITLPKRKQFYCWKKDLSTSLGVGLRYDKRDKGRYDVDQEFKGRKSEGAAEFTCKILDFQRDQDVRLKVGYEGLEKVPYLQIRENNWTLSADMNGRWNVRFDL